MQFHQDSFWQLWCSLVGYRLLFHDHRRWTGHPWMSNGMEYIFDAGAKLRWCHANWIVNFLILMRKFSMRQNVRTCFLLWIQHQTTELPTHFRNLLTTTDVYVTSLKFPNVYPICNMEKVERGGKMIYDLQYWRRFSPSPFEKCKNLFEKIHLDERTR